MIEDFHQAFEKLLGLEGDYSNHPADPGGKTRFGVTEAVARQHGYTGDMRASTNSNTRLPLDSMKLSLLGNMHD